MSGWMIAAIVVGSWCALSVPFGILVGHVIAGRPLRAPATAGSPRMGELIFLSSELTGTSLAGRAV